MKDNKYSNAVDPLTAGLDLAGNIIKGGVQIWGKSSDAVEGNKQRREDDKVRGYNEQMYILQLKNEEKERETKIIIYAGIGGLLIFGMIGFLLLKTKK